MTEGTDNVIDIRSRKPVSELSNMDIFRDVNAYVVDEWYYHESEHSLNKFITSKLPEHVKVFNADYRNDLNVISRIEFELGMVVAFFHPGCTKMNPEEWLINFHDDDEIFSTLIATDLFGEDPTESYVRTLNIIIYLSYQDAKRNYLSNKS